MEIVNKKSVNAIFVIIFCSLVAIVFCYPFLNDMILLGPDTAFHMNRIEALSIAIQNEDFYPRIFFYQNFNFGYGSPLFYSFFFLYIPALLRIVGVGIVDTYRIFLFMCSFFASMSMYYCARLLLGNRKRAYWCFTSIFYVWNCFYISDFYKRGALGEVLAFIFIPIVIMGMYHSVHGKSTKINLLVVGFCGLLLSHNITFLIMVVLYGIYLLINARKLVRNKKRLINIAIAVIFSILMTSFFTLPMLEQLMSGSYRINSYFGNSSLSETAMNFVSIFDFRTDASNYLCDSVGPFLLFFPVIGLFLRKKHRNGMNGFLTISGYIMVLMTTNLFPWKYFEFLSFLQFPTRLLVPATAFLAIGAGYTIAYFPFRKDIKFQLNKILMAVVLLVGLLQLFGVMTTQGIITGSTKPEELKNDPQFLGSEEWYNILELSTPDYLPADASMDYRRYNPIIVTNNELKERERIDFERYNDYTFTYDSIKEDAYYIMPLTYYKGYAVEISKGSQIIESIQATRDSNTGLVRFEPSPVINDGEEILFRVYYKGTIVQKITGWISFISVLCYLLYRILVIVLSSKILNNSKSKKIEMLNRKSDNI